MSTRLHIVVSEGLRDRIDGALGPGQSRGDFVRRAVERALELGPGGDGVPEARPAAGRAETQAVPSPAPAEQPEKFEGPRGVYRGPEVEAEWREGLRRPAREFRPYPKGGG